MRFESMKRCVLGLLLLASSSLPMLAQYNPTDPAEPGNIEQMLSYKVGVHVGLEGAGTVTGAGTYKYGTNVTINATTNAGYKFLYWQKGNEAGAFSSNTQFTYTVAAENVQFTAVYERLKVITVDKNNNAAGTVTGSGSYQKGQTVTLKATANKFYEFSHWVKDGGNEPYSTVATCSYTVDDEDATFTAVYNCPTAVNVVSSDERMGTVEYEYSNNVLSTDIVPKDIAVGNGTSGSYSYPFYNYYQYSTTQSIYSKSEIGFAGKINSISYYVSTASSYSCNIKIYMGHKKGNSFSSASDYATVSNLTLVYSHDNTIIGKATG